MKRLLLFAILGMLGSTQGWSGSSECAGGFTSEDGAKIRGVVEAYRTGWLRGDADGVLSTFTDDAVLLPANGARPVVGKAAITKYWWPADAPPSKITRLDLTVEGIEGDCALAHVYGHDDVAWTQ